ncbi:unnamed protein product [Symbiodinium microadriaticum]|nr:unnamed protein product [Symbiodinium sp. KB8]CAE7638437.1 unnamed protein product [Symbiodinium microadriaticum]
MSMFDDHSLRECLRSASKSSLGSDGHPSPAEKCLQAPPQAMLEKMLGFSLDPESYRNLVKANPRREAGFSEKRPAEESAGRAPAGHVETPDEGMALPVEIHSQVLLDNDSAEPPAANNPDDNAIPNKPLAASPNKPIGVSPNKPMKDSLSPGSPEFISFKPAAAREILAVVNEKLHAVEDVKRKLNFETSSEASTAASSGQKGPRLSADNLDTQIWEPAPGDYVNAWLEQQKLEHAAKVHEAQQVKERQEHEAAKESLRDKLDRSMEPLGHPSAYVITRRDQLALSAGKKGKDFAAKPCEKDEPAEPEEAEEDKAADPPQKKPKAKSAAKSKAKAKATPKSKAAAAKPKMTGKRKAGDEWPEWSPGDWDEAGEGDWGEAKHVEKLPAKVKKGKSGKFSRSSSKRRLNKLKAMKKIKSGSEDWMDNKTEYYGDGFILGKADRERSAGSADPSGCVRKKVGQGKPVEEPVEPVEPEQEGEPEDEEEEEVATFARRYCGKRPYYRNKFLAIRDAYNGRVRVFLSNHSKMEDSFWRFVAQALKDSPPADAQAWTEPVQALTYDFLVDDNVSKTWSSTGNTFFNGAKRPTKRKYEAKLLECSAH